MFKYFKINSTLQERIKDLERQIENLIGSNQVLQSQLSLAQSKEANLLEKLFDVSGINKKQIIQQPKIGPVDIIKLAKNGIPWSRVRANLEMQAQEEYWANKNKEKENGDKKDNEVSESNFTNNEEFTREQI